jgi:protocatechuate 3,4-dioxygenase beta subunit
MAFTSGDLKRRISRKVLRSSVLQLTNLEDRVTPVLTGMVFQDFNANGAFDTGGIIANNGTGTMPTARDLGLSGITVTAYDANNAVVGTATTGPNGSYTLVPSVAGQIRVEFTGLPAGVFFGPSGSSTNTAIQFVDANATAVNLALVRPEDLSPDNPQIVTSMYVFAGGTPADANSGNGVIIDFALSSGSADGDPDPTNYLNPTTHNLSVRQDNVGTTWGLAYDSSRNTIYAAAFMKRHSGFGPGGPGAIYRTGISGTTASVYANLNTIYGDFPAGNLNDVFRNAANQPVSFLRNYTSEVDWARDGLIRFVDVNGVTRDLGWDTVGKIALGGLDTDSTNSNMFTVALGDRRLYSLPTTGALNTTTVRRFDLPLPSSVTGRTASNPLGDLRPFAVEWHRGLVYVGAVNSAESTQNRDHLKAYVFAFDPATGQFVNRNRQATTTEAVLEFDLNYDRGHVHMAGEMNAAFPNGIATPDPAEWNPWSPIYRTIADQPEAIGRSDYPQPMLTGLSFDSAGNLVLGIRDRSGDQFGRLTAEDPLNPNAFNFFGMTAGDTLRAFINTPFNLDVAMTNPSAALAGWTLESNGRSPAGVGTAPQNSGQGPGGGEFYFEDELPRDPSQPPVGVQTEHDEVSVGGVLQLPGTDWLLSTAFDPVRIPGIVNTGGIRWYDNQTGMTTKQYQIYATPIAPGANTFAKANGLGDLIAITTPPPIEIGNYIWNDQNRNGRQDPGEAPLANAVVELYDSSNAIVATATTDAGGNYIFSSGPGANTASRILGLNLTPNTAYQVRVSLTQSALARKEGTVANSVTGANGDSIDSDAITVGSNLVVNVTTGPAGAANHTFDIGVADQPLVSVGNFVWNDVNNNGVLDTGEQGINGVTVNLYAADGSTLLGTQSTTGNGGYQFNDLVPGGYIVEILPPAGFLSSTGKNGSATGPFEPGVVGNLNNQDHGTAQANGTIRAAVVALASPGDPANPDTNGQMPNNANFNIDFGLFRPQAVGNFVWDDVNNNGKLDTGESGIPGVAVDLLDGAGALLGSTVTDGNGNYRFDRLGIGAYAVRITPPAGYRTSTGTVGSPTGPYEPGVSGLQDNEDHGTANGSIVQAANFNLGTPGTSPDEGGFANLRQDFGLFRPLRLGNFVWEDANNDGDFDSGETPLAGVAVALLDSNGNPHGTTTTNSAGEYVFENLSPGTYIVRVTTPAGYTSSTGKNGSATGPFEPAPQTTVNNTDHGTTNGAFAQSVVNLGGFGTAANPDDAGTANLRQDFGFFRPLSLGNFVWEDANNNGKLDTGETGIAGVAVELLDGAGTVLAGTVTNAAGNYLFTNLGTGTYRVRITAPAGYQTSSGTNGSLTGPYEPGVSGNQDNEDHGSAAGAFVQASTVTLGLPGTNPDSNGVANLRQDFGLYRPLSIGNLVWKDANNNGKFDTGEVGVPNITVRLLDGVGGTLGTRTTDANGNYLFENLAPGAYTVEFDRPGNLVSSTGAPNSVTGPYELTPGAQLPANPADNEDKGNTLIGGTVVRARTVTLTAFGTNPDNGGAANLRQDFGLIDPIPPALARVSGYVYRDTFMANGIRQPADGEAGISFVTVTLLNAAGTVVGTTSTNAIGFYEFTNLPAGAYTIVETQPVAWIDGLDRPGSLGGTHPSNDVLTVVLAPGDAGVEYNFGEVIPAQSPPPPPPPANVPDPSKQNFLGSSQNPGVITVPPGTSPPVVIGSRNPSFSAPINTANTRIVVTAGGAGSFPEVRVFDYSSGSERFRINVYENTFLGGVRVATADVDGDGVEDVITGSGIGGGPRIRVFSGVDGSVIREFFAFEDTFRGGIFVAGGDIDADGKADIIVGAEVGGGPRITTFSGADGTVLNNFFAFDPNQRGGTRIAAGDFNNDGRADIVASTGFGVPTRIRVFNGVNTNNILQDYAPFENSFTGGITVAVGDVNGDGRPDIITGAELGGGPRVQVFNGVDQQPINSFFAFEQGFTGGARVAAQDVNGDGRSDIIVATGVGRAAETRIFNAAGLTILDDFFPVDTIGGIYVG